MAAPKRLALAALAALSLLGSMVEAIATGRVEPLSVYGVVDTLLSLIVLFWWYHLDKAERRYQSGRLMNAGMLVAAAIALPIYFVRSRGWKHGSIAIGLAAAFLGLMLGLEELGERIGLALWGRLSA